MVLAEWLTEAHRKLQPQQFQEVLTKFATNGLPLYLRLAFEEVRLWHSYTPPVQLSPDLPGIIGTLFDRLESPQQHGQLFVSHCLGYLAAARNGLAEDELLDVLSDAKAVFDDFIARSYHTPPEPRLPVVVWSRLFFDLAPYLTERQADHTSLIGFYHRALEEAAATRYLANVSQERHSALARYFGDHTRHPLFKDTARKVPNYRVASELPHQQRTAGAGLFANLESTLTDLHFVEAKCAAGMTYDLITDYVRARETLPELKEEAQKEREREEAGRRYGDELMEYAKAYSEYRRSLKKHANIHTSEPPATSSRITSRLIDRLVLRQQNLPEKQKASSLPFRALPFPPHVNLNTNTHSLLSAPDQGLPPHTKVQAFHQFVDSHSHLFVKSAQADSFCIQTAYNYADAGPVAEQAERIITTERSTAPLLLRVIRPPFQLRPDCLRILVGHTTWIDALSITPDGMRAVSGGFDTTVRVWNLETGECERVMKGQDVPGNALAYDTNARVNPPLRSSADIDALEPEI